MPGQIGLMPVLNWKYRNLKCSRTVLVAGELQWMESALSAQQVGRRRTATMISFIFSQGATRIMGTGPSLQCPNQCSLPQVLRLSHFLGIQMHSWFWRNYVVTHIGRDRAWWWANGQKWPLLGLPVGSLALPCTTHPPTST